MTIRPPAKTVMPSSSRHRESASQPSSSKAPEQSGPSTFSPREQEISYYPLSSSSQAQNPSEQPLISSLSRRHTAPHDVSEIWSPLELKSGMATTSPAIKKKGILRKTENKVAATSSLHDPGRPMPPSKDPYPSSSHPPEIRGRVRTSRYPLGDNTRTYLEGMSPLSSQAESSSSQATPAASGPNRTVPTHSIFTSPADIKMASRQTHIETMAPAERQRQEQWAQTMITRTSSCPQEFAWMRVDGGYVCAGGHHHISDELLAEGQGGLFLLPNRLSLTGCFGPYYPDPNMPKVFRYGGTMPLPQGAPESIGDWVYNVQNALAQAGGGPGVLGGALLGGLQSRVQRGGPLSRRPPPPYMSRAPPDNPSDRIFGQLHSQGDTGGPTAFRRRVLGPR
jgi:hypothetical protein